MGQEEKPEIETMEAPDTTLAGPILTQEAVENHVKNIRRSLNSAVAEFERLSKKLNQ